MASRFELKPAKTYATEANAIKAVEKFNFPDVVQVGSNRVPLRYYIAVHTDGRFFPVFLGEAAVVTGVHFHFNVVG